MKIRAIAQCGGCATTLGVDGCAIHGPMQQHFKPELPRPEEQIDAMLKIVGVARSIVHKSEVCNIMVNGATYFHMSKAHLDNLKRALKELDDGDLSGWVKP